MEEDNKKLNEDSAMQEDFADFAEDENIAPEIDEDLIEKLAQKIQKETQEDEAEQNSAQEENKEEENVESSEQELEKPKEYSPWDEFDLKNSAVKKYIFYVSKDFVQYIDNLTTDERSAYINDAIQKKIDLEDEQKQKDLKSKIRNHFLIMILTIILSAPFVLFVVHKAIIATFDNYKYSQESFEKLYKDRFLKDKAYIRSVQYNKEQVNKRKK
ncbi:MAG: hypothetical protein IJB79_01670 [Candidatus Gastranaerophilales bacterium]|nr:hypothetical protein [Candidatus Gastranaerophilales bacterium]